MIVTLSADVAQEVEHFLGKEEVSGSSPDISFGMSETRKILQCKELRGFFYP